MPPPRIDRSPRRPSTTPAPNAPAKNTVRPSPSRPKPRPADAFEGTTLGGAVVVGRRDDGPGAVTLSKDGEVQLQGRGGPAALVELGRLVEQGAHPLKGTTEAQREKLLARLTARPESAGGKPTLELTLRRSAVATTLLELAAASTGGLRERALGAYVNALAAEPTPRLRTAMLVNLEDAKLALPAALKPKVEAERARLLPPKPPYDEWFKGQKKPELTVKHYVMEDFWREETASWRRRGFEPVSESAGRIEWKKVLEDPTGKNPPVTVKVSMVKDDQDVLRDLDDAKTEMVVYSGHSQIGGIVTGALAAAPKSMHGTKLVQLYQCRSKQVAGALLERYPGVHLTGTFSSSYASDDAAVLSKTFEMIAKRGSYADLRDSLRGEGLLQGPKNYMLPDDARHEATLDVDDDGRLERDPLGGDRFYDPSRKKTGGAMDMRAEPKPVDPQKLPGAGVEHAVAFANSVFYYFAEENRAAPLPMDKTDHFVADGWFKGDPKEAVRVKVERRGGEEYYRVAVNSAFGNQSKESLAAMTVFELQRYFATKAKGKFTAEDQLRGVMLVGTYADMMVEFSDDCDRLLANLGKRYGIGGLGYDVVHAASLKDGEHGMATDEALAHLTKNGVTAGG